MTTSDPGGGYGGVVVALSAATGHVQWTVPVGGTYFYFPLAYDNGTLFVNNFDGTLTALDPANGSQRWSVTTGYFSSEPVAYQGVVYLYGAGTVYAVSEQTHQVAWTAAVDGDGGSLAVDSSGVYANGGCSQTKISLTGAVVWNDNDGCSGGGGGTSYLSSSLYFATTGDHILVKATGEQRGTFNGTPAFTSTNVYLASGSAVYAETNPGLAASFTTTLPGPILAGPVVGGTVVYVATDTSVYGINSGTGKIVTTLALPESPGGGGQYFGPPSDMNIGNGLLVVPTGAQVTAFG